MRRIDLEKAINEKANEINNYNIIPGAREMAQRLGEGGKTSEQWASAKYKYSDDVITINYQVYAMGDEEIDVYYKGKEIFGVPSPGDILVFSAKERVNDPPRTRNPCIVNDNKKNFEILKFDPQDSIWVNHIQSFYQKIIQEIPEDELDEVKNRIGIREN